MRAGVMSDWEIVITGCGTSHGNPPWGRPDLWSDDPRDLRRRSGAVLRGPGREVVLIDLGPDLLYQMRDPYRDWDGHSYPERCITRCDGVLLTHNHADHVHGINELRHLNRLMQGAGIVIHGHGPDLLDLHQMFPYCFAVQEDVYNLATPALSTQSLEDGITDWVAGLPVTSFPMSHGPAGRVSGYRIGNMAYCTDCKELPESADRYLHGLDLLVLDMLREAPHVTHMGREEALAVVERLQPRATVLVHMGHEVRYAEWVDRLPPGVELAYDGWASRFDGGGPVFDAESSDAPADKKGMS